MAFEMDLIFIFITLGFWTQAWKDERVQKVNRFSDAVLCSTYISVVIIHMQCESWIHKGINRLCKTPYSRFIVTWHCIWKNLTVYCIFRWKIRKKNRISKTGWSRGDDNKFSRVMMCNMTKFFSSFFCNHDKKKNFFFIVIFVRAGRKLRRVYANVPWQPSRLKNPVAWPEDRESSSFPDNFCYDSCYCDCQ